jgi:site-specific DNA recombinase
VNRLGYKTRRNKEFSKGTIEKILKNPIYIGRVKYGDKIYPGEHNSIIDESLWLKAQSIFREKGSGKRTETKINRVFPLAGLLWCGECGSMMTPTYTQNRKRNGNGSRFTYYYRCTKTYKYHWNTCPVKSVNAQKIEHFIIEKLKHTSRNPEEIKIVVDKINKDEERKVLPLREKENILKERLKGIEIQIDNLVEAIAHGGLRFPEIKDKLEDLERQKEHLKSQLDEVKIQIARQAREKFDAQIVFNTLKDFTQRIESSSPEEGKSLLQYLIKDIVYSQKEITVNLFYLPPMSSKNCKQWLPLLNNFRTLRLRFKNTMIKRN